MGSAETETYVVEPCFGKRQDAKVAVTISGLSQGAVELIDGVQDHPASQRSSMYQPPQQIAYGGERSSQMGAMNASLLRMGPGPMQGLTALAAPNSVNAVTLIEHECLKPPRSKCEYRYYDDDSAGSESSHLTLSTLLNCLCTTFTACGCVLTITHADSAKRVHRVDPVFSREADAKAAVAEYAVTQGIAQFISDGHPQDVVGNLEIDRGAQAVLGTSSQPATAAALV